MIEEEPREKTLAQAFEKSVDLLSRRDHSERELIRKLKLRKFSKEVIQGCVVKLKEYGYLSDERYARLLLPHLKRKGLGTRKIQIKFQEKGLKWTEELKELNKDEDADEKMMEQWLVKKMKTLNTIENKKKVYEKLMRFLINKGFEYEQVQKGVKRFMEKNIFMIFLFLFFNFHLNTFAQGREALAPAMNLHSWFVEGKWFYALLPVSKGAVTSEELEAEKNDKVEGVLKKMEALPEGTQIFWNREKLSFIHQVNPPPKDTRQILGVARKKGMNIIK